MKTWEFGKLRKLVKVSSTSATYPWGEGQGQRKGCTDEGSQEGSENGGKTWDWRCGEGEYAYLVKKDKEIKTGAYVYMKGQDELIFTQLKN